jgi:hypothetical protein
MRSVLLGLMICHVHNLTCNPCTLRAVCLEKLACHDTAASLFVQVAGVSGKFFDKCRPITSSAESYDIDVQKRLWEVSAELCKMQ